MLEFPITIRFTEIQSTYTGMMIAIPNPEWQFLNTLNLSAFAELLKQWAATVDLKRFASSPKGEKKPKQQRQREPHRPHVFTARLLLEKQRSDEAYNPDQQPDNVVKTPAPQA